MNTTLKSLCEKLTSEFDQISKERKLILKKLIQYIKQKANNGEDISLVYVCTHNSRRSHFGQVWGKVASEYYQIENVRTYSAGTEATAMHPNTVKALQTMGFSIQSDSQEYNPYYSISFDSTNDPIIGFSKTLDHLSLPSKNFAAIMTCSEAEQNCPFVPGAELRVSTTYEDPKEFDGSAEQDEKYIERSLQIARENLYIFSKIHA
ncbi:MAG: protein-tyrosine-phosphatase [Flavobacteriia bacterium]|jgi:protein-tyrosine phosphatase/arsenate reductase